MDPLPLQLPLKLLQLKIHANVYCKFNFLLFKKRFVFVNKISTPVLQKSML